MTTVGELVAVLRADTAQFTASMEKASAETEALKGSTTNFSKVASTAFIAAGAVAVVAIAKMVDSTIEWARSVKQLQNTTGQTAESASALLAVAGEFGLNVGQATTAFGIFEKNIVSGNKNIEKFGLVTHDAQGQLLPFDQLLSNAADTYVGLRTQVEKTAFAQLVFGRSGRALIPILKQGSAGLAQLEAEAAKTGLVIGQGTVDAAVNLGIQMRKLGESFHGLTVSIGAEFLPIVTKIITEFVTFVQWLDRINPAIPALTLGITALAGAGALMIRVVQGVIGAWSSLFGATTAETAADEAATEATVTLTGALTALTAALERIVPAAADADASLASVSDSEVAAGAASTAAGAEIEAGLLASIAGVALVVAPAVAAIALLAVAVKVHADSMKRNAALMLKSVSASVTQLADTTATGEQALIKFAILFDFAGRAATGAGKSFTDLQGATEDSLIAAFAAGTLTVGRFTKAMTYIGVQAPQINALIKNVGNDGAAVLNLHLRQLITNANVSSTALANIGGATDLVNAGIARMSGTFDKWSQVSGQDTTSILSNLQKVVNDGTSTPAEVSAAFTTALGQMRQANQQWHASIVGTFGGAGSAMDAFANKMHVDIGKAIGNLHTYTSQITAFGNNIATIHKEFGKGANDFIAWATSQGLAQQGLVAAVASANKKNAQSFITSWKTAQGATNDLASQLQKTLAPFFEKMLGWIKAMALALGAIPPPKVNTKDAETHVKDLHDHLTRMASEKYVANNIDVNTSSAEAKAHHLTTKLTEMANGTYVPTVVIDKINAANAAVVHLHDSLLNLPTHMLIDIKTHVHGSDLPDEVLRKHLFDPMKAGGFKKINGRWTLPLDVGVHSSLGPLGGHGSLSPIGGGGNDPSSLAEMLMKQAGWKNNFQNVLDRVNAAGQSPNYIDRVTQKLADKLGPAAAKAFRSALTDLDVQSGRIDPRWMTQAFKNVSYIPEGHTNISTNHHHDNSNRGGGIRVILDRRHYDQQASYQEDYGRGF